MKIGPISFKGRVAIVLFSKKTDIGKAKVKSETSIYLAINPEEMKKVIAMAERYRQKPFPPDYFE
jgi:hypothetical protein